MSSDDRLSQSLTDALRRVPGVVDVFDAHPPVESTVRGVAAELDLAESTGLVHIDRSEGLLVVTAHVATDLDEPTPETLARAADAIRSRVTSGADGETLVSVTAHLVDAPGPSSPV